LTESLPQGKTENPLAILTEISEVIAIGQYASCLSEENFRKMVRIPSAPERFQDH
jgi:hypothetical protein